MLFFASALNTNAAEQMIISDDLSEEYNSQELSKVSILEKELQDLTGRIEILEHAIKELQVSKEVTKEPVLHASSSKNAQEAKENIASSNVPYNKETEQREYDLALSTLKDEKYSEAEQLFEAFITKYPKGRLSSNAYFWYSESFYRRNDFDKSAIHYLKHYQKFPGSSKAPDSLLKLALSLGELNKNKEACIILKKLDDEFKKRSSSSKKRSYDAKIKFGCK